MKRLLKLVCLSGLICLPVLADAPATNLIKNPSFETAGAQPDLAADWSRWGQWINREDSWSPVHDGKALIGYHHWQIEKADDSGIWQDVNVTAGTTYEFAIFASHDDPKAGHDADMIELRLEGVDGNKVATIESKAIKVSALAMNGGWTRLSVSGKATTAKLRVLVCLKPATDAPRAGSVKIDDASLIAK